MYLTTLPGPNSTRRKKNRIIKVIGHKVVEIEHIGSTSIPGLGAKPIIDIIAGLRGSSEAEECLPPLSEIGYRFETPQTEEVDWYYCLWKRSHSVGYNLHLVKAGSQFWEKHILFRDYLMEQPEEAIGYQKLKERLASKFKDSMVNYTDSKSTFIDSIVEKARTRMKNFYIE